MEQKPALIERVFGRKSTGVVYLVCALVILAALGTYAGLFFLRSYGTAMGFVGYAFFCVFALAVITAPIFAQKKWKLFVPPFIEICLSFYVVLYFLNEVVYKGRTEIIVHFMPAVGGAVIAMAVFSVLYSWLDYRAEKKSREAAPWLVALLTFFTAVLVILLWHLVEFLIYLAFYHAGTSAMIGYLLETAASSVGVAVFSLIGWLMIRSDHAEGYKIKSFKNTEKAKRRALREQDDKFYEVIDNNVNHKLDYRAIFLSGKAKFLWGRLIYLVLYAGYLVYLVFSYLHADTVHLTLVLSLIAAFCLNLGVAVYEFILFRRDNTNAKTKLLFRLKIIKSIVRILSLLLTIDVLVRADYALNEVTALTSVAMILVNAVALTVNLYGTAKRNREEAAQEAREVAEVEARESAGPGFRVILSHNLAVPGRVARPPEREQPAPQSSGSGPSPDRPDPAPSRGEGEENLRSITRSDKKNR